jgi:peptidoglycan hydrolase CwlO-like protein
MKIRIPVSAGELTDKITILEIKSRRVRDKGKLKSVKTELKHLQKELTHLLKKNGKLSAKFKSLKTKLYKINTELWNIENNIRTLEAKKDFGKKFVTNARKVYITNDKRSEIKNKINGLFGSEIAEVKQYSKYR